MLEDLARESHTVGLEIHAGKTKLSTNTLTSSGQVLHTTAGAFEVLPVWEGFNYLGRHVAFSDFHAAELRNRINVGWRKFAVYKRSLCSKDFPLKQRLKLFHLTVAPSVLYGSGCWTLTAALEDELRTAHRKMLRKILGAGRRQRETSDSEEEENEKSEDENCETDKMETWADWLKRVTSHVEGLNADLGLEDWTSTYRRRKFRWAGHVLRRTDGR
eukprot:12421230-Karenia_brevis.AAC.1